MTATAPVCQWCTEPTWPTPDTPTPPGHPCCAYWAATTPGRACPACAASRALNAQAERNGWVSPTWTTTTHPATRNRPAPVTAARRRARAGTLRHRATATGPGARS